MRLIALALLATLTACSTQAKFEQNMNSYVGSSEANLVSQMGPPQNSYTVDAHTKILTWSQRGHAMMGTTPVSLSCDVNMTVVDGRVERWTSRGNQCIGH
jgi:hypothetical protein